MSNIFYNWTQDLRAVESYCIQLESEASVEEALEFYQYDDIVIESIGSKLRNIFAKARRGDKEEAKEDVREVIDELKEDAANGANSDKQQLSKKTKIALATTAAVLTTSALIAVKNKDKIRANAEKRKAEKEYAKAKMTNPDPNAPEKIFVTWMDIIDNV